MNLVLVLRSEIACAVMLILLLAYYLTYENKSEKIFLRICTFALTHVICDGIAVCAADGLQRDGLTVNHWLRLLTYCGKYRNLKRPLSIAIGIADIGDDTFASILDVVSLADKRMYEDKLRIKQGNP